MGKKRHCQPANRHRKIQIALVNNASSSTNKKKAKRTSSSKKKLHLLEQRLAHLLWELLNKWTCYDCDHPFWMFYLCRLPATTITGLRDKTLCLPIPAYLYCVFREPLLLSELNYPRLPSLQSP
uniref:Uncharacterized protein n=1 Tax=Aegilops tauschii subsp. strangulata TaxID=200361 RepID=A0A453RTN7_AEGTS